MPRTRIIVAVLAALALAAPAASADPHAIDAAATRRRSSRRRTSAPRTRSTRPCRPSCGARGRDGVPTGSLAGTTDATTRALAQERAYSTYGEPAPIKPAPAPSHRRRRRPRRGR